MTGKLLAVLMLIPAAGWAASYTWNGSAGDGDWTNSDNWDDGSVPASLSAAGGSDDPDTITFDGDHMPTENLATFGGTYNNDSASMIFNSGGAFSLDVSTSFNGGFISESDRTILTVGDGAGGAGDVTVTVSGMASLLRHGNYTADFRVNADGVLNFDGNLELYADGNKDATLSLDGGSVSVAGNVDAQFSSQAGSYIEFLVEESSFTAEYGGAFDDFAEVQADDGSVFVDTAGGGLELTDNGDTFTVKAVTGPGAVLSTVTNFVTAAFTVNVDFNKDITGLEESDFAVSNGTVTASSLTGSGSAFSVEITPAANGDVTVQLPANSVTDTDGGDDPNPASNEITVFYIAPGSEQPQAVLSTTSSTVSNTFTAAVDFNEAVTGLELDDFEIENGTVSNLTGSGAAYTLEVIPDEEGDVTLNLPADVVTDLDGDGLKNIASDELTVFYDAPLTAAVYGALTSDEPEFTVYLTFSDFISGLDADDISVDNGSVLSVTMQGRRDFSNQYYRVEIEASDAGEVTVSVPAGAVSGLENPAELNQASEPYVVDCTSDFNEQWIIDDDWTSAALAVTNLTLADGFAEPSADSAHFTSVIKTFASRRKAAGIVFEQSPVWDNWISETNGFGPAGIGAAPIFLPVAENDYYFFGLSSSRYYTWHSTNMVDWTKYGQVTGSGYIWATTAEYYDGSFYIYLDHPNDHTPHLYIDDNVFDDELGTFEGMVFNDPTHGSDSAVIRDNEDGLFHIVSEDWTPLPALSYSADSPLATHASSPDGVHGYTPAEHLPPIDLRTEPTGEIGSYTYPEKYIEGTHISNPFYYEVHEPEQDSFGDWTAIKVGSRQYLFCDYEPTDGSIRIGRFHSDSIYEEYEFVGEVGIPGDHPDPTVGFAGGTFYLLSQQDTDYYSPGPWVDGVEARVGVDVDGDGVIDQWTDWQAISEQYDHTPGYARCVTVTSAQVDLSALPEGYGFQYEFRVDNSVVSDVSPIMDRVVMEFEESAAENLALGKTAEQSSTAAFGGDASLAVDGDTNGSFWEGSVTHTDKDGAAPAWWQVDLGADMFVDGITVYNRTDSNMSRLNDFTVSILDNAGTTAWSQSFSNYPNPSISMNTDGALGRYVRVDQDSDEVLSLAEVEVYESGGAPRFDPWAALYSLSGTNAAHDADPDGDRLNNLGEYAFGGNPTSRADVGYFPMIGNPESSGSNALYYVYPRRIGSGTELSYYLECCGSLISNDWKSGRYTELPVTGSLDEDFETVTNRIETAGKTNEFIRVRVEVQ